MKHILNLGWGNSGYQLGTGIHSGWADTIKEEIDNLEWISHRKDEFCEKCGEQLEYARVPRPYTLILFRCKNGHKYYYENTD